jgi:hypothetical protein
MQNPEIAGVEYQHGTLWGYTVKEYLLEKYNRTCQYCGAKKVPFEVDHVLAKSRGGSNRVSNLTLACHDCNEKKDNILVEIWLKNKPEVLKKVLAQARKSLRDAAAVNVTRNALLTALKSTGIPVETGTGAQTKFNRHQQGYPKSHWIDAACVGDSGNAVDLGIVANPLHIRSTGHGSRQMCSTDRFGFPNKHKTRQTRHFGFSTGDTIEAVVSKGKKVGVYHGRVICRVTGRFDIRTSVERVTGISYKCCRIIHLQDGYSYQ